jgi:hypothetical protein
MSMQTTRSVGPGRTALQLEFPQSLAVYDTYPEAQKAVDYLSDNGFPVQDVLVVGTELKSLERVTGRLTRGRVVGAGALSGAWLGFFVGMIFALFATGDFPLLSVLLTVLFGIAFGAVWALAGYALTKGQRDFTSISQIVATKYEVLTEHRHVQQARELLTRMDPFKAAEQQVRAAQEAERAALARAEAGAPQPAPYAGQPGASPAGPGAATPPAGGTAHPPSDGTAYPPSPGQPGTPQAPPPPPA